MPRRLVLQVSHLGVSEVSNCANSVAVARTENDASTVWATPMWSPTPGPDLNGEQNVFDFLDESSRQVPIENHVEPPAAPELALCGIQAVEVAPLETPQLVDDTPRMSVSGIQAVDVEPMPVEPDTPTVVDYCDAPECPIGIESTKRPETTNNGTQTEGEAITSTTIDNYERRTTPKPPRPSYPKPRAQIGSDAASLSIIAADTAPISRIFSKIVAGTFSPSDTSSLGVLQVDGSDWTARFHAQHAYLNGVLMAVTVPRKMFLWHALNFPVDEDTWTRSSLVRTLSMVTESPRHLHSYPFRHARSVLPDKPKVLLHWDVGDCDAHVRHRFKELVRVGGELQARMGNFSYKQIVVCVTLAWSLVQGQVRGTVSDEQDSSLDFLDRMGILTAIPVDERVGGKVHERDWCPSSIKVGDVDQSVTAYLQEVRHTHILLERTHQLITNFFVDYIHWFSRAKSCDPGDTYEVCRRDGAKGRSGRLGRGGGLFVGHEFSQRSILR